MTSIPFLCARCTRALRQTTARQPTPPTTHRFSQSRQLPLPARASPTTSPLDISRDDASARPPTPPDNPRPADPSPPPEKGAMARRLEEATEDALLSGGRAGRRAVEEAGFSDELKHKLLNKLADAQFTGEHGAALAEAGLSNAIPETAGEGTRHLASAQPWAGEETPEDAVLRMLHDARKPLAPGLRGKPKIPSPAVPVDMRPRRDRAVSAGHRAASARDKAQAYAGMGMKDSGLSEKEREAMRREFKERFAPGARAMPNTITGLAALANERIEDAIARGQFKNIPRGKGIERDTRAGSPFIDTTEYIMNNMIKRQEIVPPWIEKQQELLKAANVFRSRLRNDWRRHAARMIASKGGTLAEQMNRAAEYARAEEVYNPRRRNVEQISVPTNSTDDVVMAKIRQQPWSSEGPTIEVPESRTETEAETKESEMTLSRPFRDAAWEAAERSYMELAISNLNAIARSYNLMAPELAKKPYFSLQRELDNCFAEVAPQLANEIKERAARPPKSSTVPTGRLGVFGGIGSEGGGSANIYDSKAPHYGLKEFWKDFWNAPK